MKHILILPDGTRVGSGVGTVSAIKSVTISRTVNDGTSLTPGSAVAAELEASLFTPGASLVLTAGQEVQLLRVDDNGVEQPLGIFLLEKPLRPTHNTMRITGFDRLVKLDKDLTDWISGLTDWPYPLLTFSKMVCEACDVTLVTENVPNGDYLIPRFTRDGITGRQLIRWLGEIACRFCSVNAAGALEFGWYTDSGINLVPTGEHFYFQNGLSYEDYTVQPVSKVQLKLGEGEDGYLWPPAEAGDVSYVVAGNPLLSAVTPQTEEVLQIMTKELSGLSYTPCKVTVPPTLSLNPGHRFTFDTPAGESITTLVMTRTDSQGKTTLESTGSPRRSTADKPLGQLVQESADRSQRDAVSRAAGNTAKALEEYEASQTQQAIFNKLTDNGKLPGLFMEDGQLYINASYLKSGIIDAAVVQVVNLIAERLKSVSGSSELNIDGANLSFLSNGNKTIDMVNEWEGMPLIYMSEFDGDSRVNLAEISPHHLKIGGTSTEPMFAVEIANLTSNGVTEEWSRMEVGSINPDKTLLFSGNVTMGNSFTIPKTERYDLFAVKLGHETMTYDTTVLAYKTGNVVRGVGGWAGTATESKQLYFFSATLSGINRKTWTLEDAGVHNVYIGGTVEEGTRLNLKEVIGVI